MVQVKAFREGRKLRDDDHKQSQQALGFALLIKMIRVHSNFKNIHQHIEDRYAEAARREFKGQPWEFYLPLANHPDPVHFTSEEMGMLMALKNDDVFNEVLQMDVIHNGLIQIVKKLDAERDALTDRLKPDEADDAVFSSTLDDDQMMALRPQMFVVNRLIEDIRVRAKLDFEESREALNGLQKTLQDNLGLSYKLEPKVKPKNPPLGK